MAEDAVDFIRKNAEGPFLLHYWAFSVHSPWHTKQELIEKYENKVDPLDPQHNPVYAGMVEVMDDAVGRLLETLEEEGILVLGQGVDGSPKQLQATFKANPETVLLGAASFWEGIDVVGDALSILVIARLPFNVPTDPIFAARSALFDDPFKQYAIPQATIRFKQGFGRLIRSKSDRGVLVVFDRRLQTMNYGSAFLDSIPLCTVVRGSSHELPSHVARWLGVDSQ